MRVSIKTKNILSLALCAVLSIPLFSSVSQAQLKDSSVAPLEYIGGYPTKETAQKYYDELDSQRAVEVYLWALPMASYGAMFEETIKLGGGDHAVLVVDKAAESQQLVLTFKQYRLAEAANPPETTFVSMTGKKADFLTHEGFEFFESLSRYVNANPPRPQDMAMLGMLETLGIAHGREFNPDKRMREILTAAARKGRAMAEVVAWHPRVPDKDLHPYDGSPWKKIFISEDPTFHSPDYLLIDQRTRYGFEAIGTSKSMTVAAPGQGSQYVGVYQDDSGRWLTGDHTFSIHLPKDIPAADFWSLTVYDNHSRSLIQNDQGRATVGTVHGTVPNADGTFDTYYGPKCPDGVPEENWIQTKPGVGFFVYLRLYGPLESFFDKTWRPGDPKLVK